MNKLNKYSSLLNVIKQNEWYVDLFAIEVGARGYPSTTLSSCLKKLGFSGYLLKDTINTLGRISMECSFFIWLCRNSKEWSTPVLNIKTSENTSVSPKPKAKNFSGEKDLNTKETKKTPNKTVQLKHAGFINKGNTCYANAILQAMSTFPSFWSRQLAESGTISPLARALSLNLSLLGKRSSPIDPSNFLRALQNLISKKRSIRFNINTQQDAPEILQIIIDNLKEVSVVADDALSSSLHTTTTCEICHSFSSVEIKQDIVQLPLTNSVASSLNNFLSTKYCRENNRYFCSLCNSLQDSVRISSFASCGNIIIFQLIRYVDQNGRTIMDNRKVKIFTDSLTVPVKIDNTVTLKRTFKLKATINYRGTLNLGHYWAFIREEATDSWLKCNDTSVIKVNFNDLSNDSSYILVYSTD